MNQELTKLQNKLDKTKWYQSEIAGQDLSGKYSYCLYCPYIDNNTRTCTIPHKERISLNICAISYIKSREECNNKLKGNIK